MEGSPPVFNLPHLSDMPITLSPISPKTDHAPEKENTSIQDGLEDDMEVTEGNTDLHTACITFNVPKVEELLKNGASVDRVNMKDRSCLHEMALSYLYLDIVGQATSYKKLVDIVTLLAKAGLDFNMGDLNKQSPLHYVASHPQQDDLIKVLFFAGVKVNGLDRHGDSPLHIAVKKGDPINVSALMDGGGNANMENKHGDSSLHIAAKGRHHSSILARLIKGRGEVNKTNRSGKTPLHIATKAGRIELVEILLKEKADPKIRDNAGQTPLHLAAAYDMTGKMCHILLQHKAEINATDGVYKETALHKAVRMKMVENIDCLVRHKAKINVQDISGDTALHKAVDLHQIWAWKNLLIKGYKYVHMTNVSGKTALRLAQDKNNQIAVSLMRLHAISVSDNPTANIK